MPNGTTDDTSFGKSIGRLPGMFKGMADGTLLGASVGRLLGKSEGMTDVIFLVTSVGSPFGHLGARWKAHCLAHQLGGRWERSKP